MVHLFFFQNDTKKDILLVMRNPHATRRSNIFDPNSTEPFALSRSKIELLFQCPRCFYLDRRIGVAPPRGFPFRLNEAVDLLLKKECDSYREKQEPHHITREGGETLIPFKHDQIETWRDPFKGVRYHDTESNFIVFGGVDDVWKNQNDELVVVDYKATSKDGEVDISAPWQRSYKRQLEIYQWLLRKNGFKVSPTGYFLYANGDKSREAFNDTLHFKTKLIPYEGTDTWVADALKQARTTLSDDRIPNASESCEQCRYRSAAGNAFRTHLSSKEEDGGGVV